MRRRSLLLLASALVAPALAAQDRTADIDRIFAFATAETPGCAVGVSRDGTVLATRAYGLADVERRTPLTARTRFDIGSTHKQFVAAAILLLVEDGRLRLSDDIRTILPELPDYGHVVTVDHLLTHTGGIRDWTALLPIAPEGTEVLPLILRQRGLNFTPGTEWSYSNSGYVLLKEIVARRSGLTFAEFARTRLFEPLGMRDSEYVADILQGSGERALAYQKAGDAWRSSMRLGNQRGGGTVITTVGDLLRWNDALTAGRLGASVVAKLEEPATLANGRALTYARGLMVTRIPGGRLVSHSGGAAGFSSWLGRFTDAGLSIATACNFEPVSASSLASRVADLYLPPVDRSAPPPGPVAVPGVDVAGRVGIFFDEADGAPLRLGVEGGRLAVANGPPLVPVAADRFRPPRPSPFFRSEEDVTLTFRSDDLLELQGAEGGVARFHRAVPWTPTPDDLAALAGRYRNDEVGSVFEVSSAGSNGIVLRLGGASGNAVTLEAVSRDTFMRSLMIARFVRDARGRVTALDYGNPLVRRLRFERVEGMPESSAPSQAPAPPTARNRSVLRYLSPESHISVTTVAPGPSRRPTAIAASTFAPDDVPAKSPSSRASRRAIALASSVATGTISSNSSGSQSGGT